MPFLVECVDDRANKNALLGPIVKGKVYTVVGEGHTEFQRGVNGPGIYPVYWLAEVRNPSNLDPKIDMGFGRRRFKRLQDTRIASLKSLLNPSPTKVLEPA